MAEDKGTDRDKTKPEDAARKKKDEEERAHEQEQLDEALDETFPASDPVAPQVPRKSGTP